MEKVTHTHTRSWQRQQQHFVGVYVGVCLSLRDRQVGGFLPLPLIVFSWNKVVCDICEQLESILGDDRLSDELDAQLQEVRISWLVTFC